MSRCLYCLERTNAFEDYIYCQMCNSYLVCTTCMKKNPEDLSIKMGANHRYEHNPSIDIV